MTTRNPRALLEHRNALCSFIRHITNVRSGGAMSVALETLAQALPLKGALAYQAEPTALVLVGDDRLPRRAKPWLAHLPRTDEGWFVAQKVAHSLKPVVDKQVADTRVGHSIRPVLEEARWRSARDYACCWGLVVSCVTPQLAVQRGSPSPTTRPGSTFGHLEPA